jgi:hypothetical protein
LTPEHFLVAKDAVLARCGEQIYAAHEVPTVEPDKDGMVIVTREPGEVICAAQSCLVHRPTDRAVAS